MKLRAQQMTELELKLLKLSEGKSVEFASEYGLLIPEIIKTLNVHSAPEKFALVPIEMTRPMKDALGFMCFQLIGVANLYRNCGHEIARKAEEEQAFFLFKFLLLAVEHGEKWRQVLDEEIKGMLDDHKDQ